jgi:hypothetical protein
MEYFIVGGTTMAQLEDEMNKASKHGWTFREFIEGAYNYTSHFALMERPLPLPPAPEPKAPSEI